MWNQARSLWLIASALLLITPNQGSSLKSRIINGNLLESVSEYAVEVLSTFEFSHQTWGGGTLIASNVVLTQAQLVYNFTTYTVRFGSVNWGAMYTVGVSETAIFPIYNPESHANDIGLLRLAQAVDEVSTPGLMQPVLRWTQTELPEGLVGVVQGFGAIATEPFVLPITMKTMQQVVIAEESCRSMLGTRESVLPFTHFCAIDPDREAAACLYDNGNGFIGYADGIRYIFGVASIITNMCRPQFPVLYQPIASYNGWIDLTVSQWS